MRIEVDRDACVGHAQCSAMCPSVFAHDELGYAVVLNGGEVPRADEDAARMAVDSCPEQAITVVSD